MGNIFSTNRSSLTIWPLIASAFICSSALANELYREALRPQFHFTSAKGYINDPNGLVYVDGKYHLFFQAGPINAKRWGHAISTDLIHWNQLNDAISPANGHPAFSGCAVIDHDNTSGLQTGEAPPLVAVFTSWGEGQCLAFSNDQGMSWKRYEGNPVLKLRHDAKRSFPLSARDPHVMWYEQQQRWVMVLYENLNAQKLRGVSAHEQGGFSIFTSPDLKQWTRQSHLSGFYVCPDVFELPIQGEKSKAWVAMDWAKYTTGTFDGTRFSPHGEALPLDYGSKDTLSANQTWKHLSDGRVIQICWIRGGKYPGMPFDQQHSFPTSLSLRRVAGRLRLCKQPICEISQLYGKREGLKQAALTEGQIEELGVGSHSYDLQLELSIFSEGQILFDVLGVPISLTQHSISIRDRTVKLEQPLSSLRVLADATSLEVFVNDGLATMTFTTFPPDVPQPVRLLMVKGEANLREAKLFEVQTIWNFDHSPPKRARAQ